MMGRVIKGPGHRLPGELLDAKQEAAAIVAAARAQADGALAAAATEVEAARQRGYADGQNAAAAEVTRVVAAVQADAERAQPVAQTAAVALAAKMAAKIVGRAVETSPAVMAEIAAEALRASRARTGPVKLRVHPLDRAALAAAKSALIGRLVPGAALEIVDDPTVGRHGCIVDTPAGRLDARLDTQVAVLEKALLGEVKRTTHG